MKGAVHTISITGSFMTNLIMQVEHILPLKQDGSESMKREVDEPFKGSRKWLAVTNDGRTIDTVSLIEIEDLFRSNDNFSVQKN